jgi:hypothetical protein
MDEPSLAGDVTIRRVVLRPRAHHYKDLEAARLGRPVHLYCGRCRGRVFLEQDHIPKLFRAVCIRCGEDWWDYSAVAEVRERGYRALRDSLLSDPLPDEDVGVGRPEPLSPSQKSALRSLPPAAS